MSNHLAIATVTASLQRIVQSAVQVSVEGARATTVRPNQIATGGAPEVGVNIFLYQAVSNPSLANIDAAHMRAKAVPVHRHTPLDLYYMFSFYGNEVELQPQRLLGSVVSILSDKSILSTAIIRDTCNDPTLPFLKSSDLHLQVPEVSIVPVNLTFDDLSKTWSVFYQTPYVLSIAYKVMVVVVEGEESLRRNLPIRDRGGVQTSPFPSYPRIDRVVNQTGRTDAIFADSTILIQGQNLKSGQTEVKIDDLYCAPVSVKDQEVVVDLSTVAIEVLRAGAQDLRVVHRVGANLVQGLESNSGTLVLCPKILRLRVLELQSIEENLRSGILEIKLNLRVGAKQRVVVAMNEFTDEEPHAYLFDRSLEAQDSSLLRVNFQNVHTGKYLVRLLVDGAETKLEIDDDPNSPTYQWYNQPRVRIR